LQNALDDQGWHERGNAHPGNPPNWSPDGTKIVFWSTSGGNSDIYVINANGTNRVRLTTHAARDDVPNWSPDGTRIAFMSERAGNPEIYVMNANGSGVVRLTNHALADRYPVWSPTGSEIAFNRGNNIYVMNADGTNVRQVTSSGDNYYPDWR
jgi:Tol biopolymer transport system component